MMNGRFYLANLLQAHRPVRADAGKNLAQHRLFTTVMVGGLLQAHRPVRADAGKSLAHHRLFTTVMGLAIALLAGCAPATPSAVSPSPRLASPTGIGQAQDLPLPATEAGQAQDLPLPAAPTSPPTPTPPSTPQSTSLPTYQPTTLPTPQSTPLPTYPPTTASPLGPWEPLPIAGLPGPWVDDVAFATLATAFVVADRDVYRSGDGGQTWTLSLSIYRGMRSLAVSPAFATDGTVFAADGRSLVFRSADGGDTWEEVSRVAQVGGASDADVWLSISPAFATDRTLWAAVEGGVAYRSTDGGLSWEPFDPGVELDPLGRLVSNPGYPADSAPDPALEVVNPADVGGVDLPEGLSSPPLAVATSDGTLLLGTMRGLYRSTDGGATWADANAGLPASPVGAVAVVPDGALYASAGDAHLFRLPPGGARWEPLGLLPEGDFGPVAISDIAAVGDADAPVLVITTRDALFVSRDGGLSWDPMAGDGLPPVSFRRLEPLFSAYFAGSGVGHLVYSGRIYRTEDGGDSWTRVEGVSGVRALIESPGGRLLALAGSAVYEWAPESSVGWMRHPADVSFSGEPIVARFVTERLAVAVVDGDVYLSEDGGRSWALAAPGEPAHASGYLISPRFDADRAIYARGEADLTVSTDAGQTWVDAGQGLPPCEHYDSPECALELLDAVPFGDGYVLYAIVRHDFHTRLWRASTQDKETRRHGDKGTRRREYHGWEKYTMGKGDEGEWG